MLTDSSDAAIKSFVIVFVIVVQSCRRRSKVSLWHGTPFTT
ncbi:hypothetical protein HMPREF1861_00121 [Corynebacterium kroppenstedtii]|nr:hypothetical protein HMPREF1861_00121 [Corynebacterium kroppenstedtii]